MHWCVAVCCRVLQGVAVWRTYVGAIGCRAVQQCVYLYVYLYVYIYTYIVQHYVHIYVYMYMYTYMYVCI